MIISSQNLLTEFDLGCLSHRTGHKSGTAYASSTLGVLTAHKMPTAGVFSPNLAGSGNLDSFAQALMGLLFRHL